MTLKGKPTADDYLKVFPVEGISDAQAQERAERLDVKERRFQSFMSVKGVVIPELPWKRGEDK